MQACSNILSTHSKDAQQTALPLRPGPPYTISSPLSSYSFIATSSTNSQPQESILWSPDNRAASTHGTCNQSQLSVDVPGPVTCDQILTTQAVNLAVFQTTNTLHGPFVSDSSEKSEYALIYLFPFDVKSTRQGLQAAHQLLSWLKILKQCHSPESSTIFLAMSKFQHSLTTRLLTRLYLKHK